ncbi:carboxymuconolactone decarboxylase family protein [Amycolatopsis sp. NPDC049868]|uniref:carboxymuconolactone decarboxylase family protein n=1 Tax=Amycolatopsis sp. NPDC049868 TaxID=3363934 RepID=UPI003795192C
MGFITTPNAVMAELLAGYNALTQLFGKSSLPARAKHVVWITASVQNACESAHSTLALKSGVDEVEEFLAAGYTERNVLDVILGVGMKTLSNYTNHIAHTPRGNGRSGRVHDGRRGAPSASESVPC